MKVKQVNGAETVEHLVGNNFHHPLGISLRSKLSPVVLTCDYFSMQKETQTSKHIH